MKNGMFGAATALAAVVGLSVAPSAMADGKVVKQPGCVWSAKATAHTFLHTVSQTVTGFNCTPLCSDRHLKRTSWPKGEAYAQACAYSWGWTVSTWTTGNASAGGEEDPFGEGFEPFADASSLRLECTHEEFRPGSVGMGFSINGDDSARFEVAVVNLAGLSDEDVRAIADDPRSLGLMVSQGAFDPRRVLGYFREWQLPRGGPVAIDVPTPGVAPGDCAIIVMADTRTRGSACHADFNEDGFLDFFDLDAFVSVFEGGADGDADYNGDGFVDFFDMDDFVNDFEAGC